MESIVKQRLVQFIKFMNLTQKEFEDRCGMSNGYVANIRKSLGRDKILSIAQQFPELNRDWLLYGEGEMLNGMIRQEVNGNDNTSIAGNGNNVNNSSALERAIDEIAAMRELLQEQVKNNKEQFDRFMCIIEKLSK